MKPASEAWLPDCAFEGLATLAPLVACAAEWGQAWWTGTKVEMDFAWRPAGFGIDRFPQRPAGNFGLLANEECRARLASAILGRAIEPRSLKTEQDRALVDGLVDRALNDLAVRIEAALPSIKHDRSDAVGGYELAVPLRLESGQEILRIASRRCDLIEIARRRARPARPAAPLHRRTDAIAPQAVELFALVGRATLSFQDLQGMEVGDVLTLDAEKDTRRDLLVAGRLCAKQAVAIAANDDRLSLIIEQAVNQW